MQLPDATQPMPSNEHLTVLRFHRQRLSALLHRARVAAGSQGLRAVLRKFSTPRPEPASGGVRPSDPPGHIPAGPRVLVIDTTLPRPDRDSGSVRAFELLKLIGESGLGIDFLPERGAPGGAPQEALHAIGVRVLPSRPIDAFRRAVRAGTDYQAVIICRYYLAEYWIPLVRAWLPKSKLILDTVDLHHLRESREGELRRSRWLQSLAASTLRRELAAVAASDETWVVSPAEREYLQSSGCDRPIRLVPNLHETCAELPCFDNRNGLLFVGGAGHPPNTDAVRWLLRDILPRIHAERPDIQLHLVGAGLSDLMPVPLPHGVICHDHVPDLAPLFAAVRIGIAPLRFGAGVKGKVSQCLALGLPVVATPCAAEGMHLTDGVHALIAEDAAAFAKAIVRLHDDRLLWDTLATNGRQVIESHFSPASVRLTVAASLDRLPHA